MQRKGVCMIDHKKQEKQLIAIEIARQYIEKGEEIPMDVSKVLFPPEKRECELQYFSKESKEEILTKITPVPLQEDKTFPLNVNLQENGWINKLIFGENSQILKTLIQMKKDGKLKNSDGSDGIKLIYIDPPFATKQDFKISGSDQVAYADKLSSAEFIEFLRKRLILAGELLTNDGCIFVHLDNKMCHYIKIVMDEIFGKNNFVNEIIWKKTNSTKSQALEFGEQHDTIYVYCKDRSQFKYITKNWGEVEESDYQYDDNDGKGKYQTVNLVAAGTQRTAKRKSFEFLGVQEQWLYSLENLTKFYEEGRIYKTQNGKYRLKKYLNEANLSALSDLWVDKDVAPIQSKEQLYPTQKPEKLLERIIKSTTNENDIVLDFFAGSGTTAVVSQKLNRRWIAIDVGKYAVYTIQKRLLNLSKITPFMLYTAGLYDPKKLNEFDSKNWKLFALQLWGCQSQDREIKGFIFDGIKDNCLVKVFTPQELKEKGSKISLETINEINSIIGKNIGDEIFIIAPQGQFDFAEDDVEIRNRIFHILRVPYSLLAKFTEDFTPIIQPHNSESINEIVDSIGFDFIQPPFVDFVVDNEKLIIKQFRSNSRLKGEQNTELSMILIDYDYNGEIFDLDKVIFNSEIYEIDHASKSKKIKKEIKIKNIENRAMFIFVDNSGNEKKVVIDG